ncbi:MAG: hypothetical protein HY263_09300 [Chloroflexi bacterium]|nr:hypothetical protein [Chloroflexota bacterium]
MKRYVVAVLWFLAVWTAASALVVYASWPGPLAPALGLAVGAFVWLDPTGRLWGPSLDRAIMRRRLADLPRVAESPAGLSVQRETESAEG